MDITLIMFVAIGVILVIITIVNNKIDRKKFIQEVTPYFGFLKEKDYEYLLKLKYGDEIDSVKMYNKRLKNAGIAFLVAFVVIFLANFGYIYLLLSFIIYFGLSFTSRYVLAKYCPSIPIQNSCIPPINTIITV